MTKQERKRANQLKVRREKKKALVDFLGGKCIKCGYNKCIAALEFHHRDPSEKDFEMCTNIHHPLEVLKEEVKKCDLLCRNCHAEEHFSE